MPENSTGCPPSCDSWTRHLNGRSVPIPDLDDVLPQLGVDGAVLDPIGVFRIGQLLGTAEGVARRLDGADDDVAALSDDSRAPDPGW